MAPERPEFYCQVCHLFVGLWHPPTTASVCPQLTTGEQTPGLMPEEGPLLLQSSETELTHIPSSACSVPFPANVSDQLRLNTKKFTYTQIGIQVQGLNHSIKTLKVQNYWAGLI